MPTDASPGTNQYRCNACGRYFNTAAELAQHETQCRAAKTSTRRGVEELAQQDASTHAPNDRDTEDVPSKRGARPTGSSLAANERPVPSQAEGDEETIDQDIEYQERKRTR